MKSQFGRLLGPVLITVFALMAIACATAADTRAGTLHGSAAYRERIMLPPDAVFEAQLQDIARADAPATVLGRARLDPAGQPPFRFEIAYDEAAIRPGGRYTVRATVTHRGQLLFTTDRIHPVLDGSAAPVELLLVSARRGPPAASAAGGLGPLPASFEGELPGAGKPIESGHADRLQRQPRFTPIEPRLFLGGMFVYMADAANIVLCADARSVPVAMEAGYPALEAAYLKARSQPGERLLVSVEGLLALRPSMEESQPPRTTLVVERFVGIWPGQRCPASHAAPVRATR